MSTPSTALSQIPASERFLLWVLADVQFTHIVDFMVMMPLGPQLTKLFGLTDVRFGLLVSAYAIGVTLGAPFMTLLLGRWPRRRARDGRPRRPRTRRGRRRREDPAHAGRHGQRHEHRRRRRARASRRAAGSKASRIALPHDLLSPPWWISSRMTKVLAARVRASCTPALAATWA